MKVKVSILASPGAVVTQVQRVDDVTRFVVTGRTSRAQPDGRGGEGRVSPSGVEANRSKERGVPTVLELYVLFGLMSG